MLQFALPFMATLETLVEILDYSSNSRHERKFSTGDNGCQAFGDGLILGTKFFHLLYQFFAPAQVQVGLPLQDLPPEFIPGNFEKFQESVSAPLNQADTLLNHCGTPGY
jgi:hypothetical protein